MAAEAASDEAAGDDGPSSDDGPSDDAHEDEYSAQHREGSEVGVMQQQQQNAAEACRTLMADIQGLGKVVVGQLQIMTGRHCHFISNPTLIPIPNPPLHHQRRSNSSHLISNL